MATEQFANNAKTNLNAAVNTAPAAGTVETWTVLSTGAPFPQIPQFRVIVDQEIVLVTAVVSSTQWTVTRGDGGTTPATHANGALVTHILTAEAMNNALSAFTPLTGDVILSGQKTFDRIAATDTLTTVTVGSGAGTSATASLLGGDVAGVVTIVMGTSGSTANPLATIKLSAPVTGGMAVSIEPTNATAADANLWVSASDTQSFSVSVRNLPTGTVTFSYIVVGGIPTAAQGTTTPTTVEVGKTSLGGTWATPGANFVFGSNVTMPYQVTMTSFRFYCKGGASASQAFTPCIYNTDASGNPTTLVCKAAAATTVAVNQAEGWVEVTMPTTTLNGGSTYTLCLLSGATSSSASIEYAASGTGYYTATSTINSTFGTINTEAHTYNFTVKGTTTANVAPVTVQMGNSTLGQTWTQYNNGYIVGNPFPAPETGALTNFSVYAKGGASAETFTACVYACDVNKNPTTQIGQSSTFTIAINAAAAWVTVALPNVAVTKGSYYTLAVFTSGSSASILNDTTSTVSTNYAAGGGLASVPNPWPTPYITSPTVMNFTATVLVGATGTTGSGVSSTGGGGTGGTTGTTGGTPPPVIALPITNTGAAVQVTTSSNLATLIANNPTGTQFYLANGTYNVSGLVPKDDMVFQGQSRTGVILDGGGSAANAFTGSAWRVKIANLTVQRYTGGATSNPSFGGAIDGTGGHGWQILSCTVYNCTRVGICVGKDGFIVDNCLMDTCGNNGLTTGSNYNGPGITPFPNLDPTVQNCEIKNCAKGNGVALQDNGGMKCLWTSNAKYLYNNVHDCGGFGIWNDGYCTGTIYEGNTLTNIYFAGLFHEISFAATMRYNTFTRCGYYIPSTGTPSGFDYFNGGVSIGISDSHDVSIYGNTFTNTRGSVGCYNGHSFTTWLYNIQIHDNNCSGISTFLGSDNVTYRGSSGVQLNATQATDPYSGSIQFTNNNWGSSDIFWWRGQQMNLTQFLAQNQS